MGAFFKMIILSTLFLVPSWTSGQTDSLQQGTLNDIFENLSEEDQASLLEYAQFLLLKAKETDEEREERIHLADDVMPTEETSNKIMEFSRYMMTQQKTTEDLLKADDLVVTTISFDDNEFDFGTAKEGDILEHRYQFTNTGKEALTIYDVKVSCGCTVPQWSKEPIPPGEQGEIQLVFNTKMKQGKQLKVIRVIANTSPSSTTLFIKGNVE